MIASVVSVVANVAAGHRAGARDGIRRPGARHVDRGDGECGDAALDAAARTGRHRGRRIAVTFVKTMVASVADGGRGVVRRSVAARRCCRATAMPCRRCASGWRLRWRWPCSRSPRGCSGCTSSKRRATWCSDALRQVAPLKRLGLHSDGLGDGVDALRRRRLRQHVRAAAAAADPAARPVAKTVGVLAMCYQLASSVSQLGFGTLADRWRPRVLLMGGPILSVLVLSAIGTSTSTCRCWRRCC